MEYVIVLLHILLLIFQTISVHTHNCSITTSEHTVKADCTYRGYLSVPEDLPTNTTELKFRRNKLDHIDSAAFRRYSYLQNIDLSFNLIKEIRNESFSGLTQLIYLDIRGNSISLCPETFDVTSLRHNVESRRDVRICLTVATMYILCSYQVLA